MVLGIVEVLAADIVDVDELPGGDGRRRQSDRHAEADDVVTGRDRDERNLVAERYGLAGDHGYAACGASCFVCLYVAQRNSDVLGPGQDDDIDGGRHDCFPEPLRRRSFYAIIFGERAESELIKTAAFFAPYANIRRAMAGDSTRKIP